MAKPGIRTINAYLVANTPCGDIDDPVEGRDEVRVVDEL